MMPARPISSGRMMDWGGMPFSSLKVAWFSGRRLGSRLAGCDGAAFDVAGGSGYGLDEGALAAEEAFFVGVEDGDEGDFGEVEAFAEKVDADEDVVLAFAQIAEELDALEGFDLGVHVAAAYAYFGVVAGEVFGHALG